VSQLRQCSRVTASSSPHTGQRPMTGCSVTRKAPSCRGSSHVTLAVEVIDPRVQNEVDKLHAVVDFVNMEVILFELGRG
jgi:hypothetical protein